MLEFKFKNPAKIYIKRIHLSLIIVALAMIYSCNAMYQNKLNNVDKNFGKLHLSDTSNIYRIHIFWGGCKIFPCDQVDFFVSRRRIECFSTEIHFKTITSDPSNLWTSLENIKWDDTTEIREYTRLSHSVFKAIYKTNYVQNTRLRCNLFGIYPESLTNGENSFFVFFRNLFDFMHFDPESKTYNKFYRRLKTDMDLYPVTPQ